MCTLAAVKITPTAPVQLITTIPPQPRKRVGGVKTLFRMGLLKQLLLSLHHLWLTFRGFICYMRISEKQVFLDLCFVQYVSNILTY